MLENPHTSSRVQTKSVSFLRSFKSFAIACFCMAMFSVILFIKPLPVRADIPQTLGYQGLLKNAAGTTQTGTFSFTFRIYASSTGGSALWSETHPSVSVSSGAFTVRLGSVTSFPASLDFNQSLFLSTEVGSDGEMSPRVAINSVAYAFTSGGINALGTEPSSATGGRMYYDTSTGFLRYYNSIASAWQTLGTTATSTLQAITTEGNSTTNAIQFAGGTSTEAFTFSGGLTVSGGSSLQGLTWTNATGTNTTSTNLFAANGTFTNLTVTNPLNFSGLTWTSATGTNTTSTNLFATAASITTLTFTTATGTTLHANIATIGDLVVGNVTSTNTTSTNLFFTTASGTALNANSATVGSLSSGNATLSGGTIDNTAIGGTAPSTAIFSNTTSTSATSTNFFAINGSFTNLTVTNPLALSGLTWTNATGTNTTSTNLAVTNGTITTLLFTTATGTSLHANTATIGELIVGITTSTSATTTNLAVSTYARLPSDTRINDTAVCLSDGTNCGASSESDTLQTVTNRGNQTTTTLQFAGGTSTGALEIQNTLTIGSTSNASTTWTDTAMSSTDIESVKSLQTFNGYLYAGLGDDAGDGDVRICDPTTAGTATLCDDASDWTSALDNASASQVLTMTVFNDRLYVGEGNGSGLGVIRVCDPSGGGNASKCDNASDWSVATTTAFNRIRQLIVFDDRLFAAADSNSVSTVIFCRPGQAGVSTVCDDTSDWTNMGFVAGYEEIPAMAVLMGTLYVGTGNSAGDRDLYRCGLAGGGDSNSCDNSGDWTQVINDASIPSWESMAVSNGLLFLGSGNGSGHGDLYICNPRVANSQGRCDSGNELTNVNDTGSATLNRISAIYPYNGTVFYGYDGGTGSGDIFEFAYSDNRSSYNSASFEGVYAFTAYNGVLYAGFGSSTGDGQIWYHQAARTRSQEVRFETASSSGSLWFSQEPYSYLGEGNATDLGAFKLSHSLITEAGAYDLAEMYPVSQEDLEAGDVVALDEMNPGQIRRSSKAYDQHILGVISTKPGFLLSSKQREGVKPVALAGRVPVKVSLENGPIKPGDALTASSFPGVAMKAISPGVIIGRSLEGFEDASSTELISDRLGMVMMAVQTGYYLPVDEKGDLFQISDGQNASTTMQLQQADQTPEFSLPVGSQIAQGLGVERLIVKDGAFTNSFVVLGKATFRGPIVLGRGFSGRVQIPPQQDRVRVTFDSVYPYAPRVFVTPQILPESGESGVDSQIWGGEFYVTNITSKGFEIRLSKGGYCFGYSACPIRVWFDWFTVAFEDQSMPSSADSFEESIPESAVESDPEIPSTSIVSPPSVSDPELSFSEAEATTSTQNVEMENPSSSTTEEGVTDSSEEESPTPSSEDQVPVVE